MIGRKAVETLRADEIAVVVGIAADERYGIEQDQKKQERNRYEQRPLGVIALPNLDTPPVHPS
jgi:hypothetical protein